MNTQLSSMKDFAAVAALATTLVFTPANDAEAAMINIDFEQFAPLVAGNDGVLISDTMINEDDFNLVDTDLGGNPSAGFNFIGDTNSAYTGSTTMGNAFDRTTLTEDNGSAFSIFSIDMEKFGFEDGDITFEGITASGDSISQTFTIPGNEFAPIFSDIVFNLDTYVFSSDFLNVTEVSWDTKTDRSVQYDNLVLDNLEATVASVPNSSTFVLMASGLGVMAAMGGFGGRKEDDMVVEQLPSPSMHM